MNKFLILVVKGGAELLRGLIEMLPIIGRIFAFKQDFRFAHVDNFEIASVVPSQGESIFLVKILNPNTDQVIETRITNITESKGVSSPTVDYVEEQEKLRRMIYAMSDTTVETVAEVAK